MGCTGLFGVPALYPLVEKHGNSNRKWTFWNVLPQKWVFSIAMIVQKKSHIWANDSSKQKTLFIAHLVKCGVILPEKTGKYNG